MTNFSNWLRKYSIRRTNDFYRPKILEMEKEEIPKDMVLLWSYKGFNSNNNIVRSKLKMKGFIVSRHSNDAKGYNSIKNISIERLANNRYSTDKDMSYLPSVRLANSLKDRTLLVVDYSTLDDIYVYNNISKSITYKFNNMMNTIVNESKDAIYGSRPYVLLLNIPAKFPSYELMLKMFDNFHMYSSSKDLYIWLEIFKLLFKESLEESSLYLENGAVNLTLLITSKKEYIVIGLRDLISLSKESNVINKSIDSRDSRNAWITIIKMLTKLIDNTLGNHKEEEILKIVTSDDIKTDMFEVEQVTLKKPNNSIEKGLEPFIEKKIVKGDFLTKHKDLIEDNINVVKRLEKDSEDKDIKPNIVPKGNNILDDSITKETVSVQHKQYISKHYHKDIQRAIYSLNNNGVLIESVNIDRVEDIGNRIDNYSIKLILPNGDRKVVKLAIPAIDDNGVFKNSGNEYVLSKQKIDIPIKKLNPVKVGANSFYGKLFINKGISRKFSIGVNLVKQVDKLIELESSKVSMVNKGSNINKGNIRLPNEYSLLARGIFDIVVGEYKLNFEYVKTHVNNIEKFKGKPIYKSLKSLKYVITGSYKGKTLVIDKNNEVYTLDNSGVVSKDSINIYDLIGIDRLTIPAEFIDVSILGSKIPIILILCYWKGFKEVSKRLKFQVTNERKEITKDKHSIKFADGFIIWDKNDYKTGLLLGGLQSLDKHTKSIYLTELNTINGIKDLLSSLGSIVRLDGEIRSLEAMFLDPMTIDALKIFKEPTNMYDLLWRAVEMLGDEYFEDPFSTEKFMVKGHQRVSGMVYNTLSNAMRGFNKQIGLLNPKININPYEVYTNLSSDPTFILIEDLNPLEYQKQMLEVKMSGMFGRSNEAITDKDRTYHYNDVGIFSEAGKDDGNVGSTTYLNDNANIVDTNGTLVPVDNKDIKAGNAFSPSALVLPLSNTDDGKRGLFSSVMDKHIVHVVNSIVLPFRTGYESMLPYKVGDKFCINAIEKGKVVSLKESVSIVVKYKDREESYNLSDSITRVVGGKHYTLRRKTLLSVGDVVNIGDNIVFNSGYFGQDILNPKRVAYKGGVLSKMALEEGQDSFEDSSKISKNFAKQLATKITYTKSEVLDVDVDILNFKYIGDDVIIGDTLLSYTPPINSDGLSEETIKTLSDLNMSSFKSDAKGKIINVEAYYYSEYPSMSESIKSFTTKTDKLMKNKTGFKGKVSLGYSISGKQLPLNKVAILYSIEKDLPLGIIDKCIVGNQLKTTIGDIYEDITTESGDEIDMMAGARGFSARIVYAPYLQGMINLILEKVQKNVIEMRDS